MARLVTGRMRWVRRRHEHRLAAQYRDSLEIKLPADRLDTPVPQLSGGNQQKVVLARCLAAGVRMLVLDEPTRGVSVAAKQQIHALITDLAGAGLCVIVSSSELSELLALSAHVLVLHRGHLATQLRGPQIDEHTIVRFASGAA